MRLLVAAGKAKMRVGVVEDGRVDCIKCGGKLCATVNATGTIVRCLLRQCRYLANLPQVARELKVASMSVVVCNEPRRVRCSPGAHLGFPNNAGWDYPTGRPKGMSGRKARLRR